MSFSLAEPHMLDTSAVIFLIRRKLGVVQVRVVAGGRATVPVAAVGKRPGDGNGDRRPTIPSTEQHPLKHHRKLVVTPGALIPFATMGELLIGAENSTDSTRELDKVQTTAASAPIVYPTFDTLGPYAKITSYLRKLGQMIPVNDLWIAALALQWDVLLSTDDGHFERTPNLKVFRVR